MPGLKLFTGNRLENLVLELAGLLRTPLASPLDQEVIVVQSRGMERWVRMELAIHHGICANCSFPFPNALVHELFRKVLSGLPDHSPFDPGVMTWTIMRLLPSCITRPGFEGLRTYLLDNIGNLKRFQLSERIADTFDQYLLFRPEMIFRWEKGQEDHWQAVLWRDLVENSGDGHRAALAKDFIKAIRESASRIEGLPERISVFGISALPRFHMQVLSAIARLTQVNLFLMNPCKEYWGDIVSEWEMKRTIARQGTEDIAYEELHLEKGNSLLASMGKLGRDFFEMLNDFPCEEATFFEDHKEDNLLSCLQSDILNLRDAPQEPDARRIIETTDTSIQIHSCHSPMREIEVLHDQLLHMFEEDPNLLPRDILVMTPDIETYSPYIQAVFDMPAHDPRRIPFSIADRSIRKESEIAETFLAILALKGGRFTASQVLAILESRAVRDRFGLAEADVDLVWRWVKETRIRWGIDHQSRNELGLPAFSENTWKAGLERLLLGYALPGLEENMFQGILPYDHIEGGDASVMGRLAQFAEQLFTHVRALDRPRTLDDWAVSLEGLLEAFFSPNESAEGETQLIRRILNDLGAMRDRAAFHEEMDINVIRWHLRYLLEKEGFGFGFITGGVTFCAMLPMRSIPFKVICLVGMNNDAYPRQSKPLGFDLMARHPKPGDRSRRHDDRYLFLEVLISARERLYISHVGQNIQDNSLIPPSVLVSELMDYIEKGFRTPGTRILDHMVTKHRLQAFSPEYFQKKGKPISYSRENLQAARCIFESRKAPVPFISRGLNQPGKEWKNIDLDDLCKFFGNPAKFLLERRLGLYLDEGTTALDEREAFDIKGLEKYLLEESLLKKKLAGRDLNKFLPVIRASGDLPHGTVGECLFEGLSRGVEVFAGKIGPYIRGTTLEPLEVDLCISGFRLKGRINIIHHDRVMQYRYARVTPKDRLRVWIYHLALNCTRPEHYPRTSMLAGLDPDGQEARWMAWEFPPVKSSQEILETLLGKYWVGLARPLHFFPRASWQYFLMRVDKDKSPPDALGSARRIWAGNQYAAGECEDAYYQKCFALTDPLDSEFQDIAEEVFGPYLEHQTELGHNET